MKMLQDAIRYSPSYQNPQGNLETINGDGSVEVTADYRLMSGLSVFGKSSYVPGGGSFNVSFNPYGYPDASSTVYHRQKMQLDVREYSGGFRYTQRLCSRVELSAFGSVFRSLGSLHFEYRYFRLHEEYLFSAELNDRQIGTSCGIELALKASTHFSVISSVDYRWIKHPDLQGNGTCISRYWYDWGISELSQLFEARLGEADSYFGLLIDSRESAFDKDNVLHFLWSGTASQPYWFTQQPAILDISGFGVSLGVRYEF
jgi:hypothetical protein